MRYVVLMDGELNGNTLDESLGLLGELLEVENTEPIHLLVVGGAALLKANIVTRATRDIDVLASREIPEGDIAPMLRLPEPVRAAAEQVGAELGLKSGWLNTATALFSIDLESYPPDVWPNLDEKDYGSRLKVSFLGRKGLIYFKFYAAIDPERARRKADREDLVQLAPTREEAINAVGWLKKNGLVAGPRVEELNQVLTLIGHADLIS